MNRIKPNTTILKSQLIFNNLNIKHIYLPHNYFIITINQNFCEFILTNINNMQTH